MENTKEITRAEDLNKRGLIFIKRQQEKEALKYFNKAIEEDVNYLESYYNKAMIYSFSKEFDKAMECYDIILTIDSKQGKACYGKANLLFLNKNNVKATIEQYNKAIYLGVRNETIYYNLGLCLEASGDVYGGLKWIERALRIDGTRTDFLLKKAEILIGLDRYIEAEKSYDKILMIESDNYEAYHNKSVILGELEKYEEAFKLLLSGEELLGKKSAFEYDKALLFEKQGKFKEALCAVEEGLEMNSDNISLLSKQGSLLLLLEKGEDAIKSFDKVLELEPENIEVLFNKGKTYLAMQELEEALEIFEGIIKKSSETNSYRINSYYYRAFVLKRLGFNDEAIKAYDFANKNYNFLLLDYPYDAQLRFLKANTLRDLGNYEEAEEFYEYAIDLNKIISEVYFNRAKNYVLLYQLDKAKEAVAAILKLDPGYKATIELDDDLKVCLN